MVYVGIAAVANRRELAAGVAFGIAMAMKLTAWPLAVFSLLVVRDVEWPIVDLRVDWSDDPIGALEGAWAVYAPQVEDYVRRAIDPVAAPRFGVPGDP